MPRTFYRVRVGRAADLASAEKLSKQLREDSLLVWHQLEGTASGITEAQLARKVAGRQPHGHMGHRSASRAYQPNVFRPGGICQAGTGY